MIVLDNVDDHRASTEQFHRVMREIDAQVTAFSEAEYVTEVEAQYLTDSLAEIFIALGRASSETKF